VQQACSASEIPCFDTEGIRREHLGIVGGSEGYIVVTGLCAPKFPVSSVKQGKYEAETSSPMTASTAIKFPQAKAETSHGFPVLKDGPFILDGTVGERLSS
jgi:hypothetical protein